MRTRVWSSATIWKVEHGGTCLSFQYCSDGDRKIPGSLWLAYWASPHQWYILYQKWRWAVPKEQHPILASGLFMHIPMFTPYSPQAKPKDWYALRDSTTNLTRFRASKKTCIFWALSMHCTDWDIPSYSGWSKPLHKRQCEATQRYWKPLRKI